MMPAMMLRFRFGQAGLVGLSAWVSTRTVGSLPARRVWSSPSWARSGSSWAPGTSLGRFATCGLSALIDASSWSWNFLVRSVTVACANTFARFWADTAVEPVAVTATMLLWATGAAWMALRRDRGLRFGLSFSLARHATSIVDT